MGEKAVLDPCCGMRMMWFDRADQRALFGDQRNESIVVTDRTHRADGTRALSILPNARMDFRSLPFADGSFALVAFDPPHLVRAGPRLATSSRKASVVLAQLLAVPGLCGGVSAQGCGDARAAAGSIRSDGAESLLNELLGCRHG